jgi:hypothetical protein
MAGQAAPAPAASLGPPKDWVRLGRVQVDPVSRTVVATGFVNQVEGIVELLACGMQGKRHESVFVLEADAMDLQSALLLIGASNGPPMTALGVGPPRGTALTLHIQTGVPGTGTLVGAAAYLRHSTRGALDPATPWIFTGSKVEEGAFKAQAEESYLATYWDPWAIINLGDEVGGSDDYLTVNKDVVPAQETPVTFLIRCRP